MPLDFVKLLDIPPVGSFEPLRTVNGEAKLVVTRYWAVEVVIVYFSRDGMVQSFRPVELEQRENLFHVHAPGLSPLAVSEFRHSMDYASDGRAMIEVVYYEFKGGEHIAKPEDEARRLNLLARAQAASVVPADLLK